MKKLKELVAKQLRKYDIDLDETVDASDNSPVFLVAAGSAVYTLFRSFIKVDEDLVSSEIYTPYDTTGNKCKDIAKFVRQMNATVKLGSFILPSKSDPFLRYTVSVSGREVRSNVEDAVLKLVAAPAALLDLLSPALTMLLVGRYTVNEAVADATSAVKAIQTNRRYCKRLLTTAVRLHK